MKNTKTYRVLVVLMVAGATTLTLGAKSWKEKFYEAMGYTVIVQAQAQLLEEQLKEKERELKKQREENYLWKHLS